MMNQLNYMWKFTEKFLEALMYDTVMFMNSNICQQQEVSAHITFNKKAHYIASILVNIIRDLIILIYKNRIAMHYLRNYL